MTELDKTTRVSYSGSKVSISGNLLVTIFDGQMQPRTIQLDSFQKSIVTFGRNESNDIVLSSRLVSREHGRFKYNGGQWEIEDAALYGPKPSANRTLRGRFYTH